MLPTQNADDQSLEGFIATSASKPMSACLVRALEDAEGFHQPLTLAHVVESLLNDDAIRDRIGDEVRLHARAELARQRLDLQPTSDPGLFSFDIGRFIEPARSLATDAGAAQVSPLIFLATVISLDAELDPRSRKTVEIARSAGISIERLGATRTGADVRRLDYTFKSLGFGRDLTAMARDGAWDSFPLIGMEEELEMLTTYLGTGSVCIVGEPGIGKTALIEGFAWKLAKQDAAFPPRMHAWTIVLIQSAELIAGTGVQGELETRIQKMVSFFIRNPNVVPFFDEVHRLFDTEDPETKQVVNLLKEPMGRDLFRCVACTTDREFNRHIAPDEALSQRLNRLLLPEPNEERSFTIIKGSATGILERAKPALQLGVSLSDDAIRTAVEVTSTHQRSAKLPRKAIELLGRSVTSKVREIERAGDRRVPTTLTGADVARAFSALTGIPYDALDANRPAYYDSLIGLLGSRVKGQDQAVSDVVSHLALQARGWVRPGRPRGRFVFLGPPGVGKTELASAVAAEVLGDRGSNIVLNMAEFAGQTAYAKFMGADPSYAGFGRTATIYTRVKMRSYSVVVMDEFEKSHEDLANPMISILDGSADDPTGDHVDFSQCIFFLTSNSLSVPGGRIQNIYWPLMEEIEREADPKERARLRDGMDERLRSDLCDPSIEGYKSIWTRPLVDRIDRICIFRPLTRAALSVILADLILRLKSRSKARLPEQLDTESVQAAILDDALIGETFASARRLERALLRWLQAHV